MSDTSDKASFLVRGMQESILAFERGGLAIDRLTWELKSRINALRSVANDAWTDELKSIWNQLEVVNAFFIDSGRHTLSANEETEIREILDELSAAIARYLYPYPRHGGRFTETSFMGETWSNIKKRCGRRRHERYTRNVECHGK